jgi:iron(II)-dependent oxidoreductase
VIAEARQRLTRGEISGKERYLFRYVIHHHQMHLESLIWARQTLGYPKPDLHQGELAVPQASCVSGDAKIDGGEFFIGKPPLSSGEFSFDNERPGHRVEVDPFGISKTLVTNGEFLQFVEGGGYQNEKLWDFGGRCWLADRPEEVRGMPEYWRREGDGSFRHRKFDRWEVLPPDAPVLHVSVFEAEAFCR